MFASAIPWMAPIAVSQRKDRNDWRNVQRKELDVELTNLYAATETPDCAEAWLRRLFHPNAWVPG